MKAPSSSNRRSYQLTFTSSKDFMVVHVTFIDDKLSCFKRKCLRRLIDITHPIQKDIRQAKHRKRSLMLYTSYPATSNPETIRSIANSLHAELDPLVQTIYRVLSKHDPNKVKITDKILRDTHYGIRHNNGQRKRSVVRRHLALR